MLGVAKGVGEVEGGGGRIGSAGSLSKLAVRSSLSTGTGAATEDANMTAIGHHTAITQKRSNRDPQKPELGIPSCANGHSSPHGPRTR